MALQLHERPRFDLADALARDPEGATDLLERAGVAAVEPVAQLEHLALAMRERREHVLELLAAQLRDHHLVRAGFLVVLDERAQRAVVLVADGRLERDRLLRDLEDLDDALR